LRSLKLSLALVLLGGLLLLGANAFGSSSAKGVVVKVNDTGVSMSPNKYIQDNMAFSPGTVEVKSGQTLTFEYQQKAMEPHTLTVVKQSDLPKTGAQVENCSACQKLATGHLKNPHAEPGPGNPIVHWTLNKGKPGLDTVGDSIAIDSTAKPAHKQISIKVTAKPGTTLYFLCAVHPWMQGKLVVK
jgi:plastocyanin